MKWRFGGFKRLLVPLVARNGPDENSYIPEYSFASRHSLVTLSFPVIG